ncbi:ATP-grasp domain-containing protein [Clostridium sp. 19966]|uniref:ATP-grasp domain-containing protein n=1 Tax=Clostridium sp. 19966 TaxID=2768166 RepID=UPI0028DE6A87|nr:ATP-grasp domain-containing protein [Clostridium sp. 19966]MDT8718817.1 ATP-grasp domain-containing protein [Clostridium sp. 19966]
MKVYIHKKSNGQFSSHNNYADYEGFSEMGFEVVPYGNFSEINDMELCDIVDNDVDDVRNALNKFNIVTPEIDYPAELEKYLGRKIWRSKISEIANNVDKMNVFIKPVEDKKFTGVVVGSIRDLMGCGTLEEDTDIFCSQVVNFVAEWRCFVRYGEILDVRPYRGDWRMHYDSRVIEGAVRDYATQPNGYSIDFGVTEKGETLLIEVNDGYALGFYGLNHLSYAKLLSARWAQLTGTEDQCYF